MVIARHPRLLAGLTLIVALALGSGCGGSEDSSDDREATKPAPEGTQLESCTGSYAGVEEIRVTNVDCGVGSEVVAAWSKEAGCEFPAGTSRSACSVRGYRCLSAAVERGIAGSCSQPGRSIAFFVPRRQ